MNPSRRNSETHTKTHHIHTVERQRKDRILKAARKKRLISYIWLIAGYPLETMEARKKWIVYAKY